MTELRVLLNSYHSGANAWFALAEERGHFTAEGLDVTLVNGAGAYRAPAVMVEERLDLCFGDMGALIAELARSRAPGPAAVYAIHHASPSAIAVAAGSAIHGPGDLAGRRLLTHLSDVAYRSFPAYAEAAGLDPRQVRVSISDDPMAGMLQTMLDGGADGVFGYVSSQRAVLQQIDPALADRLRFLPFPAVEPDLYGSVMIAQRSTITSKPEALRAFLRALNAGLIEAVAEPKAAVAAVLTRNPALDPAVELDRWTGTVCEEMTHPEIRALGFGAVDPVRLDRSIDRLARTIPLPRSPDAEAVFDPAFLPDIARRMLLTAAIIGS